MTCPPFITMQHYRGLFQVKRCLCFLCFFGWLVGFCWLVGWWFWLVGFSFLFGFLFVCFFNNSLHGRFYISLFRNDHAPT